MIYIIVIFLTLFYVISCFGCTCFLVDRDVELNILSILIIICPVLNTYLAFKSCNFNDTINKLKGDEK